MIVGKVLWHRFLHSSSTLQEVLGLSRFSCFFRNKVCHECGSLFYLLSVFLKSFVGRINPIEFFSHIYIMWLLPNQERSCVRRCLTCPGVCHLHPTDALESLTFCDFLGFRISNLIIPVKYIGNHLRTIPKGEVHHVPPSHFQVWATEPWVIGKSCLLWRHIIGTVYLSQILWENNATLQFLGARVCTCWEIYNGTISPPLVPRFENRL